MSHDFVESQVRQHRDCSLCKTSAFYHHGRAYSLCPKHLLDARNYWRAHVRRCRAAGRCINCHQRKLPKQLRCSRCKEVNRVKCLNWARLHPGRSHQYWVKRTQAYLKNGLCICKAHTPLPPGYRRCDACRVRHRGYQSKKGVDSRRARL